MTIDYDYYSIKLVDILSRILMKKFHKKTDIASDADLHNLTNQIQQLKKENFQLKNLIENLPGDIYWKDKEGVCQGANHNNWQDFGMSSLNEFVGKTDYDLFSKAQADHLSLVDQEVMRGGKTVIAEEWIKNADGSQVLYLSHKVPLKNHVQKVLAKKCNAALCWVHLCLVQVIMMPIIPKHSKYAV